MHMCEATIALYEATGRATHLDRAATVAYKLCVELPTVAGCYGLVCEHFSSDWQPDPLKNRHADVTSEVCV